MKEYKVLSRKDKAVSGKFDSKNLEKILNDHAKNGWRLVATTSASVKGFLGGKRDEILLILERDI